MKPLQIETAKFAPRVHDVGKVVAYSAATVEPRADEASDRIVRDYSALVVWRPTRGPCEARAVPNERERTQLEARLAALRASMRPAGNTSDGALKIGAAVAEMFAGFVSQRNLDTKSATATYVLELQHHPAWAVERVCLAVRRGKVANINPAFPPTTIQLNQLCDLELGDVKAEAAKIKAVLELVSSEQPTPADLERRKAAAEAWRSRAVVVDTKRKEISSAALIDANNRVLARCGLDPVTGTTSHLRDSLARLRKGEPE